MKLTNLSWTGLFVAAALALSGCQTTGTSSGSSSSAASSGSGRSASTAGPATIKVGDGSISTGLVTLTKTVPTEAFLGQEYFYTLTVRADADTGEVKVTDTVPSGASLVRTEPSAAVDGSLLTWTVPQMNAGETQTFTVYVVPESEGNLQTCATITAVPRICLSTFVGRPALTIDKVGPAAVLIGTDATFTVTVTNTGTAVARNVVVTDEVPQGLSHTSGQRRLSFDAGDLAPGESKTFEVVLRAGERGRFRNVAAVTSTDTGTAVITDDAYTVVQTAGLQVTKEGPETQFITRRATYRIVVANTGDTDLRDVVVTDTAPAGTTFVAASGASINGDSAVWTIPVLEAGRDRSFEVVLTSVTPGSYCNTVTAATADGGLRESATACTNWRGVVGVLLEAVDDPDPIQVGETVTFTVTVTNQGTAPITNAVISAELDEVLTAVSATRGGMVDGRRVTFPAVPSIAPKDSVQFVIIARGVEQADPNPRSTFRLSADQLGNTVLETESTTVY